MITKLTITLLIILYFMVALYITWHKDKPTEGHNIYLGPRAGNGIIDESYQFRMRLYPDGPEYATTMSHKEWKYMRQVLVRAIRNEIDRHKEIDQ